MPEKPPKFINPNPQVVHLPRYGGPGYVEVRPWNENPHRPDGIYTVEGAHFAQYQETQQLRPFRAEDPAHPALDPKPSRAAVDCCKNNDTPAGAQGAAGDCCGGHRPCCHSTGDCASADGGSPALPPADAGGEAPLAAPAKPRTKPRPKL